MTLARIFHDLRHRYDHSSARVTSAGGGGRICGLDSAVEAESARPFDKLRAPSRFDRLKAPSVSRGKVEGLALAATRSRSPKCGI
jgi:hypothetical protein